MMYAAASGASALLTRRPRLPVGGSGDLTVSLTASRTSGVAPLAVLFDATGTTSNVGTITDTFREPIYTFDFDDPGSGTWPISGLSKSIQIGGPLAAHVFETPGTYTVSVSAPNGNTATVDITVQDPAVVYPGAQTVFISASGNFAGAPAGAQTLTSIPTIVSNRRYIFRDGESFGALDIPHGVTGNLYTRSNTASERPQIAACNLGGMWPPDRNYPEDHTFVGLEFRGQVVQWVTGRRITLHKCAQSVTADSKGVFPASAIDYWAGQVGAGNVYQPREIFVSEHYARGNLSADTHVFGAAAYSAVIGCDLMTANQHTIRFGRGYKMFMGHNAARGVSSDGIRHALKFHGGGLSPYTDEYATSGGTWATRYLVIANNLFGDATDNNQWTVALSPQNGVSAEGLEDVIAENNRFVRGSQTVSDLTLGGRRMTSRGNTLVGGGAITVSTNSHADALPAEWRGPYYLE